LALDTFYLGNIEKSNYYKQRAIRGKTENQLSITKRVACQMLQAKIDQNIRAKTGKQQDKEVEKHQF